MTLPELVAARAARGPRRPAVITDEETLSYGDLAARASRIARLAAARGAAPGRLVAVALPLSADLVAALLGVLATGAACVPVDPDGPAGWTGTLLETAAPCCLLTTPGGCLPAPAGLPLVTPGDLLPPGPPSVQADPAGPDDVAWVQFVPVDGAPVGVLLSHRSLTAAARWSAAAFRHAGGLVLARPPGGGDPAPGALLTPLAAGGTLLVPGPDGPPGGWRPEFARALPEELTELALATGDECPSGELAVSGPVGADGALARWQARHPEVAVTVEYGAAETAGAFAGRRLGPGEPAASPVIGRPVAGTNVHLLDAAGHAAGPDQVGEAYVTGDLVAQGYLGRPELTADRFRSGPRMFRTGDLMRRRADGTLELAGQAGRQRRVRGRRVTPADAERAVTIQWQQVYDSLYQADGDLTEDFSGWTSSYDGQPIPLEQMREWRDATVDRIRSLRPRRVLEIGAGSGLLLSRLAPGCEQYWATDISAAAVDRLAILAGDHVVLRHQPAHDLDGLPAAAFDLVVLNSVVQYFPSGGYLAGVLSGLQTLLAPGGAVFVGDVRNLRTWRCFRAAVRLGRRSAAADAPSLLAEIARDMDLDAELLVDADFFARWPGASADIRLKRGRHHNELTRHRYDVVLRPAAPLRVRAATPLRWGTDVATLADLDRCLAGGPPGPVGVTGIPNARLSGEVAAWRLLREGGDVAAARRVLTDPPGPPAPDPEELTALARRHGRQALLTWTGNAPDGAVDALFTGTAAAGRGGPPAPYQPGPAGAWPATSTPQTLSVAGGVP